MMRADVRKDGWGEQFRAVISGAQARTYACRAGGFRNIVERMYVSLLSGAEMQRLQG